MHTIAKTLNRRERGFKVHLGACARSLRPLFSPLTLSPPIINLSPSLVCPTTLSERVAEGNTLPGKALQLHPSLIQRSPGSRDTNHTRHAKAERVPHPLQSENQASAGTIRGDQGAPLCQGTLRNRLRLRVTILTHARPTYPKSRFVTLL